MNRLVETVGLTCAAVIGLDLTLNLIPISAHSKGLWIQRYSISFAS